VEHDCRSGSTGRRNGNFVLIGVFNPTLLQPANLLKTGALTDADVLELQYDILAPEVAVAKLPWATAIVERDKLVFSTTLQAPAAEPVRDFLLEVVDLQPIKRFTALGINNELHFGISSPDKWHKFGHRLVPKDDLWNKFLKEPGTRTVMVQGKRSDGARGSINVKVEPSTQLNPGIFVQVNDHFDADPETLEKDPEQLLTHLTERWPAIIKRCDQIVAAIREFAT
jgi:hypothetical protein